YHLCGCPSLVDHYNPFERQIKRMSPAGAKPGGFDFQRVYCGFIRIMGVFGAGMHGETIKRGKAYYRGKNILSRK
ncbi:hypothetical protein, partial [Desulfuromonas acetoxidans]|uniref:hypothetical protein n=1 Tax=Desulfuromonas acetoxidans TaxID=891 RepID=UPI001A7E5FFE